MEYFKLVKQSKNVKLGKMATTYSSMNTCPDTCAFLKNKSCYAHSGFYTKMIWNKLSSGLDKNSSFWNQLIDDIKNLKPNSALRMNTVGDLPRTKRGTIDRNKLKQLISATKHLDVINYTHIKDLDTIKWANKQGYPLIHSADSLEDIDISVPNSVVISHENERRPFESRAEWNKRLRVATDTIKDLTGTHGRVFVCPSQVNFDVNCKSCMACNKMIAPDEFSGDIVAFIAHGNKKRKIETSA